MCTPYTDHSRLLNTCPYVFISLPNAHTCTWSYRDGLNRYPMEYTLARQKHGEYPEFKAGIGQSNQGLVIISEFVSSARVMRGALNVNPWRVQEVRVLRC